ncbi:MAG: hypothetical protein OXU70_10735 [Gammaproteobacteria bacterium]|nr:hypothetical protein [Gammaproteobacteria bacterium]
MTIHPYGFKKESALGEWFAQGAYRTRFAEGYASGEVIELLRNSEAYGSCA